jgi:hypothetical protein
MKFRPGYWEYNLRGESEWIGVFLHLMSLKKFAEALIPLIGKFVLEQMPSVDLTGVFLLSPSIV